MRYYGIKTPGINSEPSYIWWIADTSHNAWMSFFTYPDIDKRLNAYRLSISMATKAYESIGYSCVEVEIIEKSTNKEDKKCLK